jgi:hypothetical protein
MHDMNARPDQRPAYFQRFQAPPSRGILDWIKARRYQKISQENIVKPTRNWDPLAWMLNWGFLTALIVAFATMYLMGMWQGA